MQTKMMRQMMMSSAMLASLRGDRRGGRLMMKVEMRANLVSTHLGLIPPAHFERAGRDRSGGNDDYRRLNGRLNGRRNDRSAMLGPMEHRLHRSRGAAAERQKRSEDQKAFHYITHA
jgi:hypothetical protein